MRVSISLLKKTFLRKGRMVITNPKLFPLPVYIKRLCWSGLLLLVFLASAQAMEGRQEILSLTLDKALQIAMERNKDILRAREYRNQVEGRYVEERAAALPQLAIQGGMSRDHDESQRAVYAAFPITGFAKTIPVEREARSAGVGLNQLVYSFGQVEAAIRAAKIGIKTADDHLLIQQQSALKVVSSAFYNVLLSKELNALALQNLDQKKRHLDEAQKKYQAGTATEYDVLAAKVEVENANPDVIRTENMIRITRENLRFLIGLGNQEVDAQGTLLTPIISYPEFQESLVQAWKNRPELADLKHRIGISEELLNLAKAGNMPVVNFKAGYGWQSQDYMPGQADGPAWTIGMFVTFPFFDGLRTKGKIIQAKSNLSTLKIEETKLLDGIILQTRESVSKVKEAGEIVKGLSGTVEQAQRLLSMAEKGYEFGVKTKLDVDDAQTNLVRAQGNLAKARHDYLVSLVELEWVKGTIQPPVPNLALTNNSKDK
jgi:HAE1 family hydrophobic/amphiphilic exporter-1